MNNETLEHGLFTSEGLRSIRDALDVLGGKWKIPILISLRHGGLRFNELQKKLPGIASKVLSRELKELEANKIVFRKESDKYPFATEYCATTYCESLNKIVEGLREWGDHHRELIFDKTTTDQRQFAKPATAY